MSKICFEKRLVLIFFFFFLISCTGKQLNNGNVDMDKTSKGILHYYSTLSKEGRIHITAGKSIIAETSLFYYAPAAGVQDGDYGTLLYLEIADESLLKKDTQFPILNDILPITIAHWGSPAYYQIVRDSLLEGNFAILEYKPYDVLKIQFDIRIKKVNQLQTFNDTIAFQLNNPWHKIEDTINDWEVFHDDKIQKIQSELLSGKWEAYNLMNKNLVEKNNTIDTLLIVKVPYQLEIKARKLQNHLLAKLTAFELKDNQLILKGRESTIGFINQFDGENMQISWKNKYYYQRLTYKKVRN